MAKLDYLCIPCLFVVCIYLQKGTTVVHFISASIDRIFIAQTLYLMQPLLQGETACHKCKLSKNFIQFVMLLIPTILDYLNNYWISFDLSFRDERHCGLCRCVFVKRNLDVCKIYDGIHQSRLFIVTFCLQMVWNDNLS